jgi:hypothetical protein
MPRPTGTGRRSQPGVWTPYSEGGIGIIPRRNLATPSLLRTSASLQGMAYSNPLRLLLTIIDSDVDCSLAADNVLSLTTGDVQICAIDGLQNATAAPDAIGTAAIDELMRKLPNEIGGLEGLQSIGTLMTLCTGLSAVESVPDDPLKGVRRIWPVDSLSLMMARDNQDADVSVFQRTNRLDPNLDDARFPGFTRMNPETFHWKPYHPVVDDPYGRADFGPALAEILANLHVMQALRDCVDHTAWPRGVIEIDSAALYDIAINHLKMQDTQGNPEATNWVLDQFKGAVSSVQGLKADDWLVLGMAGKSTMMQGGSFAGIEAILAEMRSRIVRGLKQLPVMMAFQQGSTEGHTSVQWQVYARRLEAIRAAVLMPILQACNLHLRLLGLNMYAVAKYQPIRTTDALIEANTKSVQLANAAKEILLGWKSNEQAAIEATGSGPVDPSAVPDRAMLILVAGGGISKPAPVSEVAGGTQEEQDSQSSQQAA